MNKFIKSLKSRGQISFVAIFMVGLAFSLYSAEPQSISSTTTNSVEPSASSTNTVKSAVRYQITGAELYSIHCNRCHPERYPTERTAAQWKTIMLHMQVRASIPGKQARLILQYLQENSGR